jgi:hypothetical protein
VEFLVVSLFIAPVLLGVKAMSSFSLMVDVANRLVYTRDCDSPMPFSVETASPRGYVSNGEAIYFGVWDHGACSFIYLHSFALHGCSARYALRVNGAEKKGDGQAEALCSQAPSPRLC